MNFSTTYDVSQRLQDDSVKQFYWHVLLRPRIGGMLGVFAILICMIFLDPPYKPWVVGFLTAMSLFLVITWVKAYFQVIAQARAGLKLMEHPRVEITFDDSLITYASSTGTRLHNWNKMDRMAETKDFVILMSGNLPLLSLPKAAFSPEALLYMREKLPSKLPSPKAGKLLILITAVLGTTLVLLFGLLLYLWVVA